MVGGACSCGGGRGERGGAGRVRVGAWSGRSGGGRTGPKTGQTSPQRPTRGPMPTRAGRNHVQGIIRGRSEGIFGPQRRLRALLGASVPGRTSKASEGPKSCVPGLEKALLCPRGLGFARGGGCPRARAGPPPRSPPQSPYPKPRLGSPDPAGRARPLPPPFPDVTPIRYNPRMPTTPDDVCLSCGLRLEPCPACGLVLCRPCDGPDHALDHYERSQAIERDATHTEDMPRGPVRAEYYWHGGKQMRIEPPGSED